MNIHSEFVKFRFGYDNAKAAAIASIAQVLPIFLMPILGLYVDKYGKRAWIIFMSAVAFVCSLGLLGFTHCHPAIGMLMFSVSLSLGPVGLVSSVSVILPLSLVGTGMGLIKSGTNVDASLFDMAAGFLQDMDPEQGYGGVVAFFVAAGCLAVLARLSIHVMDVRVYGSILNQNAVQANQRQQDSIDAMVATKKYAPVHADWIYGSIFVALACTSWILFIRVVVNSFDENDVIINCMYM